MRDKLLRRRHAGARRFWAVPWADSVAGKSQRRSAEQRRRRDGGTGIETITGDCLHGRRCASPSSRAQNGLFAARPQGRGAARRRSRRTMQTRGVAASWPRREIASHVRIFRPAAALRRHPGDVAVGVLDVAGFAVDAVLRVDHEPRLSALLHPFVDAGRAIARRGPGIDVVLGRLLQRHVGDHADAAAGPPRDWCWRGTPTTAGRR